MQVPGSDGGRAPRGRLTVLTVPYVLLPVSSVLCLFTMQGLENPHRSWVKCVVEMQMDSTGELHSKEVPSVDCIPWFVLIALDFRLYRAPSKVKNDQRERCPAPNPTPTAGMPCHCHLALGCALGVRMCA